MTLDVLLDDRMKVGQKLSLRNTRLHVRMTPNRPFNEVVRASRAKLLRRRLPVTLYDFKEQRFRSSQLRRVTSRRHDC